LFENNPSGNPDPWHGFLLQTSFCFHSFCVKKFRTFFQRRSGNLAKITKDPLCVKSQSVAMGSFVDAKQGSQMQHRSKQDFVLKKKEVLLNLSSDIFAPGKPRSMASIYQEPILRT
jgi:hypothetical protein